MGRIDDVLNVAGHRLGTMEIESALVAHPKVAEAAVVGRPHEIKGEAVFAYVVLNVPRPEGAEAKTLMDELRNWVGEQLSPIAKPDDIRLADNLPKTRSGKIMRRLLRSLARGEEITQDVSTLENPAILEQLRGNSAAPAAQPAAVKKTGAAGKAAPVKKAGAAGKAAPVTKTARTKKSAPVKKVAVKKARAKKARAKKAPVKKVAAKKTAARAGAAKMPKPKTASKQQKVLGKGKDAPKRKMAPKRKAAKERAAGKRPKARRRK
jgi:hypothetical protein